MPKSLKLSLLAISVLLIVFVFLGGILPGGVRAGSDASAYQQIEVYSEVLQHIQNDYVVTPNMGDVTTGALHGLLEGLDPQSGYLTPAEAKLYQDRAAKGTAQIGVDIAKRYGYATVVSVVPGSAADKAGIISGDVIDTIATHGTRMMPLPIIDLALAGKPGSTVSFTVIEPTSATPKKLTLTREPVEYPAVAATPYDNGGILYLKPYILDSQQVNKLVARLKQTEKSGPRKILLDLRDVTDGNMDSAVRLTEAFLKQGTIATLVGQKYPKRTWTADGTNFVTGAPLVVLVNHGTAGPAEIVAAALKENGRAQLVGDRTFGSGAVQKQIPMPDGAVLFLSVAKYHAPDGGTIQETAVVPNIEVAENSGFGLAAPPASTGTVTKPTAPAKAKAAPASKTDDQLNKALELLEQKKAA